MTNTFLLFFLILNAVLVGVAITIAVQHGRAHLEEKRSSGPTTSKKPDIPLSADARKQLAEDARQKFISVIGKSSIELEQDLSKTAEQMDKQLQKFGSGILAGQMEHYDKVLQKLRQQAETTMTGAQVAITNHQKELLAQLDEHQTKLEAEATAAAEEHHQLLIKEIDDKLSDSVMSFLIETLQHNVDLGAQTSYLIASLDEHKAELIKELG